MAYQGAGRKRIEIGHRKSQWLQGPNATEAGCEREVIRETVAALMAGISWGRLVSDRKETLAGTTSGILGSDPLARRSVR